MFVFWFSVFVSDVSRFSVASLRFCPALRFDGLSLRERPKSLLFLSFFFCPVFCCKENKEENLQVFREDQAQLSFFFFLLFLEEHPEKQKHRGWKLAGFSPAVVVLRAVRLSSSSTRLPNSLTAPPTGRLAAAASETQWREG